MQRDVSTVVSAFTIAIEQIQDYEFKVVFDKPHFAELRLDEPGPLGRDSAPNPARVLAAAIGNCLSASLLFCARKAKVELGAIRTQVKAEVIRNSRGRLRIGGIDVVIDPGLQNGGREKASRCVALFEDYCIVTQSVREGVDVRVTVAGLEHAE